MLSVEIDMINQIGVYNGHTSLLTFYCRKENPAVDYDNKISGVEKEPYITGVDEETDEEDEYEIKQKDPQDEYYTIRDDMNEYVDPNEQ